MAEMRCPFGLRYPPELLDQLRSIPWGANMIDAVGWCDVAAGHSSPHHCLGQANGDGEHWVRWSDQSCEVVILSPCPIEDSESADSDPCLLFEGHEGPHGFEMDPYWSEVNDLYEAHPH